MPESGGVESSDGVGWRRPTGAHIVRHCARLQPPTLASDCLGLIRLAARARGPQTRLAAGEFAGPSERAYLARASCDAIPRDSTPLDATRARWLARLELWARRRAAAPTEDEQLATNQRPIAWAQNKLARPPNNSPQARFRVGSTSSAQNGAQTDAVPSALCRRPRLAAVNAC